MVEGTGISLYILVGVIIFGLFTGVAVMFGEGISATSEDLIACVESYMSDEPTECGVNDPNKLPNVPKDNRVGYTPDEWVNTYLDQRLQTNGAYFSMLTEEIEGVEDTYFYKRVKNLGNGMHPRSGTIYGVYSEDGELIETYSYGQTKDSDYLNGVKHMFVNDIRLVPDKIKNEGVVYRYTGGDIRYVYTNEQGLKDEYYVYPN